MLTKTLGSFGEGEIKGIMLCLLFNYYYCSFLHVFLAWLASLHSNSAHTFVSVKVFTSELPVRMCSIDEKSIFSWSDFFFFCLQEKCEIMQNKTKVAKRHVQNISFCAHLRLSFQGVLSLCRKNSACAPYVCSLGVLPEHYTDIFLAHCCLI